MALSDGTAAAEDGATLSGPVDSAWVAACSNPLRNAAFFCMAVYVFLRFSFLHEVIAFKFDVNTYVLYVVGLPALVGVTLTGGVQRTMRSRIAWAWVLFTVWMVVSVLFSSWRGGSFDVAKVWLRSEFSTLFLIGGLTLTWSEFRWLFVAIAAAMAVNLSTASLFVTQLEGRFALDYSGSIGNANDLAAHLLLASCILLYFLLRPGQALLIRLVCLGMIGGALYFIVGAGSRGALVAIVATMIAYMFMGTSRGVAIAAATVLFMTALLIAPGSGRQRLLTLVSNQSFEIEYEAAGSREARLTLLKQSIWATLENPIFGTGPGQFSDYAGIRKVAAGGSGLWQVSHNSYTQVSSETGLPGFCFFMAAILGTFVVLRRIHRQARANPSHQLVATAALSLQLALVGFGTASFFLSLGYRFYVPAISGLTIALYWIYQNEFKASSTTAPQSGTGETSTVPRLVLAQPAAPQFAAPGGGRYGRTRQP